VLAALRAGKIDGSTYSGACACLVGTIANERHAGIDCLEGITPNSTRPAEKWFMAIRPGMTPDNNHVAKIVEGWITDWMVANPAPAIVETDAGTSA